MRVPNGIYTISRNGEWHTFKIRTQKSDARFKPGERIIYALTGPRNSTDYTGIGTIDEEGVHLWRRWDLTPKGEMARLFWRRVAEGRHPEWTVDQARTCICCNRLLTTPESIQSGIGPECAGRGTPPKANRVSILLARKARLEAELKEVNPGG